MADFGIGETIAILGLLASGTGAAVENHQANVASGNAKDAQHKEEAASRAQQNALQQQTMQNDATNAARQARLRQRALLSTNQGTDQTISTSPLGLAGGGASSAAGVNTGTYGGGTKTTLG